MPNDLYQSKKIVFGLRMNYEKIDAYRKNCMLFWKEHKDDTKCQHCGRSRYVKVRNEDGASITTIVMVEKLHYILIMPRLK
jgi:Zn finger protein HypA/HybF involved in hydrogenase expression